MSDPTATAVPDKAAIRAELEATKAAYHELLASFSEEDWDKRAASSSWTVRRLMWHIASGAGFILQGVDHCRKGKGPNPPQFLINPVSSMMTFFGGRSATPESVGGKYDAVHEQYLACLEGIQDDEWQKSAVVFGSETNVEKCFHDLTAHFDEHRTDILKGLGRE